MSFTGTLAAVQAAVTNLLYRPATNFSGTDMLVLSVNDQGNSGSGGALSDTKTILITVTLVNDAPLER